MFSPETYDEMNSDYKTELDAPGAQYTSYSKGGSCKVTHTDDQDKIESVYDIKKFKFTQTMREMLHNKRPGW